MPRIIQVLKSIGQPSTPVEPIPTSFTRTLVTFLHEHIISPLQDIIPIQSTVITYMKELVHDKSQSELLFLTAIVLAVLLFVVILPAYEALFGTYDDCHREEIARLSSRSSNPTNITKEESSSSSLRVYKPGVGIVEMKFAEPSLLRSSSFDRCGSSGSSLSGSICSHYSLETIEESEEEYLQEDEDDDDDDEGVPQLDTTIVEEDDDI